MIVFCFIVVLMAFFAGAGFGFYISAAKRFGEQPIPENPADSRLKRQYENFFSYTGDRQPDNLDDQNEVM